MSSIAKSKRSFSKRLAVYNIVVAWVVICFSVWRGGDGQVGVAAISLIGFIVAGYMGVGHLDYRSVLNAKGPEQ
jgi:hypothetical protein